jgi:CRP-like cAMP-binding protein
MNDASARHSGSDDQLHLSPGQALGDVARREIWRLESGGMILECADHVDGATPVGLAVAGDLIGVERLLGQGQNLQVRAMTPCRLRREPHQDASRHLQLLGSLITQSRRHCAELMHLRSGTATERVKRLLLLLADSGGSGSCELPPLKEMASLVDSAPETVSRVIGNLRRLDVLHKRQPSRVSVDRAALGRLIPPSGMTAGFVCVNRGAA